jgi:hypothetical protein
LSISAWVIDAVLRSVMSATGLITAVRSPAP